MRQRHVHGRQVHARPTVQAHGRDVIVADEIRELRFQYFKKEESNPERYKTVEDERREIEKLEEQKRQIEADIVCLEEYIRKYEHLLCYRYQQVYLNVQRTLPQQGYHSWHSEDGNMGANRRILATMMYLNDDFDGGETEFLYQSLRVKPKRGMVLIWPAGFTHVHRGNPPLSGEKFIATSWLENINA